MTFGEGNGGRPEAQIAVCFYLTDRVQAARAALLRPIFPLIASGSYAVRWPRIVRRAPKGPGEQANTESQEDEADHSRANVGDSVVIEVEQIERDLNTRH